MEEELQEIKEEEVEEEKKDPKKAVKVFGRINGCKLLNIRKKASLDSLVLGVLNAASKFLIDKKLSTEDFYKISFNGINGYCLKKFVELIPTEKGE